MNRSMTRGGLLAFGCFMATGAGPLLAQAQNLCSLVHYQECHADGNCLEAPADPANALAFITIDRAAGIVRATEPRFSDQNSSILHSTEEDGRIMLVGVQSGGAWSITIVEETGLMSLAISDPDEAILVFGRCVSLDALDP